MQRFIEVVQDRRGNAVENATVTVYDYDGTNWYCTCEDA